jgi:signal transduction histidine kinase
MAWRAPTQLRELLSPLSLAALAAWCAVWLTTLGAITARAPQLAWPARGLLLLFLAAFLTCMLCERGRHPRRFDLALLLQAVGALGVLALGMQGGAAPVLLVLLAAMLAVRFEGRGLWLALLGLNLLAGAILRWRWGLPWSNAGVMLASYGAFQVFAAMLMRLAGRAEAATAALRAVNADLLATRSLLAESARDSERLRLSRELHDVAGHKLTALKLNLRQLQRDPRLDGIEALALSGRLADELLDDLRAVVRQLRSHDGLDLGEALQQLAAPLPRPKVMLEVDPAARVPDAARAEALLRVAQEGLTNAARHGGGQQAWLRLSRENGSLRLQLEDDGRARWPIAAGNGLIGMRERLEALGGALALSPSPRGGLRLEATLPLEPSE